MIFGVYAKNVLREEQQNMRCESPKKVAEAASTAGKVVPEATSTADEVVPEAASTLDKVVAESASAAGEIRFFFFQCSHHAHFLLLFAKNVLHEEHFCLLPGCCHSRPGTTSSTGPVCSLPVISPIKSETHCLSIGTRGRLPRRTPDEECAWRGRSRGTLPRCLLRTGSRWDVPSRRGRRSSPSWHLPNAAPEGLLLSPLRCGAASRDRPANADPSPPASGLSPRHGPSPAEPQWTGLLQPKRAAAPSRRRVLPPPDRGRRCAPASGARGRRRGTRRGGDGSTKGRRASDERTSVPPRRATGGRKGRGLPEEGRWSDGDEARGARAAVWEKVVFVLCVPASSATVYLSCSWLLLVGFNFRGLWDHMFPELTYLLRSV